MVTIKQTNILKHYFSKKYGFSISESFNNKLIIHAFK
ncbi:hypothetical protein ABIB50_002196 [Mucilaginibacter sp. UYCu711]